MSYISINEILETLNNLMSKGPDGLLMKKYEWEEVEKEYDTGEGGF